MIKNFCFGLERETAAGQTSNERELERMKVSIIPINKTKASTITADTTLQTAAS